MARASTDESNLVVSEDKDGLISGVEFKGQPLSYITLNAVKLEQFGPDFSLGALIQATVNAPWEVQLWSYGKRSGGADSCGFSCDFKWTDNGETAFGCKAGEGNTWAGVNMPKDDDGVRVRDDDWFHVAVHKNAGILTFYVNGVSKGTAVMPGGLAGAVVACGLDKSNFNSLTFGKFEGDEGSPAKFRVAKIRLSGNGQVNVAKAVAAEALETGPGCAGDGDMDLATYWQVFVIFALICWLPDGRGAKRCTQANT